jgi:UDP:flavonoid glycosyltransferase YjiC (YdhE family)
VEKLGIGATLNPKQFNAASLSEKLNSLITSQAVLDRCKSCADKIHPDQALAETCAIIEDFSRNQV